MRKRVRKFGVFLKGVKDPIARPFVLFFDFIGFKPIAVSLLSLGFGVAAAVSLIYSRNLFLGLMIGSFLFDIFDGALARYQRGESKWTDEFDNSAGFWIDYCFDRIVVFSVTCAVLFMNWGGEIAYYLVPLVYVLSHLVYLRHREKLQYIFVHPVYVLLLYVDVYSGTVFFLAACLLNLLLFSTVFASNRSSR